MSVRKQIADQLRADWAEIPNLANVRVIGTERTIDRLDQPTALLRLRTIERLPQAPLAGRNVGLLLTLISEREDLDLAGDDIEELTEAVLTYLGPRYKHDRAEVVGYGDRLAVDIPLTIIAVAETAPTPEEA
ncbi:hypothetical protein [Microbacterium sp. SLBN-146]|uniref:hypothetical protein n=1 Tax=Microbacterium sp. SLBN-146 TaxID=2768457 RepID=UPI001154BB53|nr:hypothetical protein [Microbacterium sp. SLBN-146]TQJ31949.1 hypothetical protein FBY39_2438 [Microbacterium sp. SLBN-146]